MYVCMYVCINLEVSLKRPRHTFDALRRWPSPRFSEPTAGEGTALAWMSLPWLATSGGDMYAYIYIYIVCVIVGAFTRC